MTVLKLSLQGPGRVLVHPLCSPVAWIQVPQSARQTELVSTHTCRASHCALCRRERAHIASLLSHCSSSPAHPARSQNDTNNLLLSSGWWIITIKYMPFHHNRWVSVKHTSSFLVTTVSAVGSRFEADKTSLSCASFFSRVSASAPSFFSSNKFLKLLFCWTSWIAFTNRWYNSSRSACN